MMSSKTNFSMTPWKQKEKNEKCIQQLPDDTKKINLRITGIREKLEDSANDIRKKPIHKNNGRKCSKYRARNKPTSNMCMVFS